MAAHIINKDDLTAKPMRMLLASATTLDQSQRKSLYLEFPSLEYVLGRRYFVGGDPEQDVKRSSDLDEVIRSYNRLS